jgi:hypothetical protein
MCDFSKNVGVSVVISPTWSDLKPKSSRADERSSRTEPNRINLKAQVEPNREVDGGLMEPMEPMGLMGSMVSRWSRADEVNGKKDYFLS